MDHNEAKNYRDELAQELNEARQIDHEQAQHILDEAKKTDEYQQAKSIHQEQRERKEPLPIKPEDIEYTGLYVDDQEALLKQFPAKHANVFAHHSTNWYRPASTDEIDLGHKSTLKVIGQAYDEKGYALLVENKKSKNEFPHITISCAPGVGAVYSNELLKKASENGTLEIFEQPVLINVTEGFVDRKKRQLITSKEQLGE